MFQHQNLYNIYAIGYIIAASITIMDVAFESSIIISYIWVFLMRFGVYLCFTLWYYANSEYFKPKVKSRAYSLCNFWARTLTIFSPMIAETVPKSLLIVSGFALIQTLNLIHIEIISITKF